jgi:probable lipoprotein NlpC
VERVRRLLQAVLLTGFILLGNGCATARGPGVGPGLGSAEDLGEHLAARAGAALGQSGPFTVGSQRFGADCSGFVASVYEAEGLPLRRLMAKVAPSETTGVAAAFRVFQSYGVVFGGGGEWPRPGDLVFFRNTFDRNRDGALDDPLTHVGVVERVEDGRVTFLHRGSQAVSRATLTLERSGEARDPDGRPLNSPLRDKRPRVAGSPALAGQLFMGYGRLDPARLPRDVAVR